MSFGPKNAMLVGNCSPLKTKSTFRRGSFIVGGPPLSFEDCNSRVLASAAAAAAEEEEEEEE
jgi:hypothetical protein